MKQTSCIPDGDLRAFLLGDLPENLAQTVAEHLESCPDCEARAASWDDLADRAIKALRKPLPPFMDVAATAVQENEPTATDTSPPDEGITSPDGFTLLEELGRGGIGVVYKARQHHPERIVALKFLLGGLHDHAEHKTRFLAEADAIAQLSHPHIVQVHAVGESQGQPYLCLEYLEGGSLAAKSAGQPQPPITAARLLEQLARAVEHAHERGVIHRDLKPANVLLAADGTPRIGDFGLARFGRPELTATGAILGTPAYMAPEQARADNKGVGPAADIWALGIILYELLTGQPPFRGVQALDTLQQVVEREPVAPRRLQPKVPRDLETICLKCLAKEPHRRYRSAAALAEDLRRFLEGRSILARPAGPVERAVKWARRRPTAATLLVFAVLLAVGTGVWYHQDQIARAVARTQAEQKRAQTEREADLALRQGREVHEKLWRQLGQEGGVFALLDNPARWQGQLQAMAASIKQTRALAQSAEGLLDGPMGVRLAELAALLQADSEDYKLAVALEKVRLDKIIVIEGRTQYAEALPAYAAVFAAAGLPVVDGNTAALAEKIRRSPIREQLLAALDDWALLAYATRQYALAGSVLALARRADPDSQVTRLRDLTLWQDRQELAKAASACKRGPDNKRPGKGLSPQVYNLVGALLFEKAEGELWVREGQAAYPADFWLNVQLGLLMEKKRPDEAAGFYRVAVALRPHNTAVHHLLGNAFYKKNDLDAAIKAYQRAIELDPRNANAHSNLGSALYAKNDRKGAIQEFNKAIALDPKLATAHNSLGIALHDRNDLDAAIKAYQRAIALDPRVATFHNSLGNALHDNKDPAGAIKAYQRAIAFDPKFAPAYVNLGIVLGDQKDPEGAIKAYQRAIALDPRVAVVHDHLGNALHDKKDLEGALKAFGRAIELDPKLAPAHYNLGNVLGEKKDPEGALKAYRRAIELDPTLAMAHTNLGNILRRKKDLEGAIKAIHRAIELDPKLAEARGALGQALLAKGDFAAAKQATQQCLQLLSPGAPLQHLAQKQLQMCHQGIKIVQRVDAILQGQSRATGAAESLGLARFCRVCHKHHAAARLYAAAFATDADLAANGRPPHGYLAACSAAAAAGQGRDGELLDAGKKAELRQLSLRWLRADLKRLAESLARRQTSDQPDPKKPASLLEKLSAPSAAPTPADILTVADRLQRWLVEPDLASVREEKTLCQLPAAEQKEWRQLWADRRALLQQVRGCFREIRQDGTLTAHHKEHLHEVLLVKNRTYAFVLHSKVFDPFLRLENAQGHRRVANDNIEDGVIPDSCIVFTAPQDGVYRIVATSLQRYAGGSYTLIIREFIEQKK
jgi:serine/threonine-protein kinase